MPTLSDPCTETDGVDLPTIVEPRPYQRRIIQHTVRLLDGATGTACGSDGGVDSVLIESPTGSGKTVMALAIARWLQRHRGMRVGWVAMRRNLLAQAARENARLGFGVDLQLISMFDRNPGPADLIVVDEAQHDAVRSMANLHSIIRPKKILGLTATPFRTDRLKLCFARVIRDASIQSLIQDGYLSRYHHFTISAYTPHSVADLYLEDPERWGKALVFFHRQEDCRSCRDRLASAGVVASVVTAQTDRERQIEAFENGQIEVLISMQILAEGFDCPSLKTVFCRPSGRGCTIQMCGRVFRLHPGVPFKHIVQCAQTRYPFTRTATPDEQYLRVEGEWRSLTRNPRVEQATECIRHLMAQTSTSMPKFLCARRKQRHRNPIRVP